MEWGFACTAQAGLVAALLGYASLRDLKYREVDPLFWAAAAFALAPLAPFCWAPLAETPLLAPVVAGNLAAVGLVAAAARLCLIGGADAAALALLALATPALPGGFPSALAATLYASAAEAALAPALCAFNLAFRRRLARRAGRLFPYCFLGVAVRVEEGASKPWWYPLNAPGKGVAGAACVSEDPHEAWARLAARGAEAAWATPGLPFLPFILAGYLAGILYPPNRIAEALLAP